MNFDDFTPVSLSQNRSEIASVNPSEEDFGVEVVFSADDVSNSINATMYMFRNASSILQLSGVDPKGVLIDGGATINATPCEHLCFDVSPCTVTIAGVGGIAFTCTKRGKLAFQSADRSTPIIFREVHISSRFPTTFISESSMVREACTIVKDASGGSVTSATEGLLFRMEEKDGLYYAVGKLFAPSQDILVVPNPTAPRAPP